MQTHICKPDSFRLRRLFTLLVAGVSVGCLFSMVSGCAFAAGAAAGAGAGYVAGHEAGEDPD